LIPFVNDEVKAGLKHMVWAMERQPTDGTWGLRHWLCLKHFNNVVDALIEQNQDHGDLVDTCFQIVLEGCKNLQNKGSFRATNILKSAKQMDPLTPNAKEVIKILS